MQRTAKTAEEVESAVQKYGDVLFRLCLVMLGNPHDAEDAVQETAVKYMQRAPAFQSAEHEKAWLLRVAANRCRDMLRLKLRHPQTALDEIHQYADGPESCGILDALMRIPEKFRIVMLLHYAEGYRVEEIAKMIGRSPSAVKMRLQKGRRLLDEAYRKECL